MKFIYVMLAAILPLFGGIADAVAATDEQQSHARVREVAEAFVREQTASLPGRIAIKVDEIDRRATRPACQELEAFLPPGARLLGNGMIGVRCLGKKNWVLFVPVHVKVTVEMLVSSHPLPQGAVLRAEDVARQEGEMAQVGVLTDPAEAIGKVLKYSVAAGQILKQEMMRPPYTIRQGQAVHLRVVGEGFSVQAEGHALGNASEGQDVQVKTDAGKVVSGKAASDGVVEVRP